MSFGNTFKALSDPTRREILQLLREKSMTAGEIGQHFTMSGASISHHLSALKQVGLVRDAKEGKYIRYELNMTVFEELMGWFTEFIGGKKDE